MVRVWERRDDDRDSTEEEEHTKTGHPSAHDCGAPSSDDDGEAEDGGDEEAIEDIVGVDRLDFRKDLVAEI